MYDEVRYMTTLDAIVDYYTYFFSDVQSASPNAVFTGLPIMPTATIDVYVDNGTGLAQVGEVIYGSQKVVGRTNYNTNIGIKSFSRKEFDEFGNIVGLHFIESGFCCLNPIIVNRSGIKNIK